MFDIGFWELSLLAVLGLLILGPERLPRVVHTAGLWLGRARVAMSKLQREIQRELMIEETRAAVQKARQAFEDSVEEQTSAGTSASGAAGGTQSISESAAQDPATADSGKTKHDVDAG